MISYDACFERAHGAGRGRRPAFETDTELKPCNGADFGKAGSGVGGVLADTTKKRADLCFSGHLEHDGPKSEVRLWYRPGTRRSVAMTPIFLAAAGSACRPFSSGSVLVALIHHHHNGKVLAVDLRSKAV